MRSGSNIMHQTGWAAFVRPAHQAILVVSSDGCQSSQRVTGVFPRALPLPLARATYSP